MSERLFMLGQYLAPHHALSRVAGWIARCKSPWLKNRLIKGFIKRYKVDMSAAIGQHAEDYPHFNAFFTRALKPGLRPLQGGFGTVTSPADGSISQIGPTTGERLLQAKGHDFTLTELLGGAGQAASFHDGQFVTIYLSPRDYHRVHMPIAGTLREMIHVPGKLFSVNPLTVSKVPRLFARNERVICLFETALGPMAVVLVGAMVVASIRTAWAGLVDAPGKTVTTFAYPLAGNGSVQLAQGDEMGTFDVGSTVIVLFGPKAVEWIDTVSPGTTVQVGQILGTTAPRLNQ
ncbi:phosphatidylserine decarboxylase [Pantoea sp. Ap-967]|uniref:archaetidylserine decarboxylase n=1 Tax=Pantoea sp. Ap-967 TaxID=2608362 RepID=UPI001422AB42|nr:archaetidylserine decarboxylase [Pantoea sp. Ap-967]NIE73638.1 phosphatidylserine decarboxylase [Pantoea sp. Ap-967]